MDCLTKNCLAPQFIAPTGAGFFFKIPSRTTDGTLLICDIPRPFPFFSLQYSGTNLVATRAVGIHVTYWELSNGLPETLLVQLGYSLPSRGQEEDMIHHHHIQPPGHLRGLLQAPRQNPVISKPLSLASSRKSRGSSSQ